MTKETALKALDDAFLDAVERMFGVMVDGFINKENPDDLSARFAKDLDVHSRALSAASIVVEKHFGGGS